MKKGNCLKILAAVLSIVMLLGTVITVSASGGLCLHDTQKRIVNGSESNKFTIAEVCKLCGEVVMDVSYIGNEEKLTFYKDSSKETAYTQDELTTGFTLSKETYLYVDNGVISKTGAPYWLTFDMKVNSLPNIKEGSAQGNLSDTGTRAYKGWSIICMTLNGSYIAPLRLIPDGWEADSGAVGATRGTVDGKSPIKFYGSVYRDQPTITDISAGDNLRFALRIDPTNGKYDVYVNNAFAGSGTMATASDGTGPLIRLWEDSANDYGGDIDITKVDFFKESFTTAPHSHEYNEVLDFNCDGVMTYNVCNCGERTLADGKKIQTIVKDGLSHIYDGLGSFTINANRYWFVTDVNFRNAFGDGALITFGSDTVLEVKDGKLVSGATTIGSVTYPATYQVAIEIENGTYKLYVNGRYALDGTLSDVSNIICGDEAFGHHVRFLYNKAVTLGETLTPVIPTYTADENVKLCYHSDEGISVKNKTLINSANGVKCVYQCVTCGERVYAPLNGDLTNPANDRVYGNKPNALLLSDLDSFSTSKMKYLYLEDNVISNNASPYWVSFDITPTEIPSNATGTLIDPNSRVYKGYGIISLEPAFLPISELRVIPDGWEEGNATGSTKGITDGKAEVKIIKPSGTSYISMDTLGYRYTETVAYLEAGKTTSFALRVDPATGIYDVYVDGVYMASAQTSTYTDMEPKIVFHDNELCEFTYSNVSVSRESYDFDGKVAAIELEAKFTPKQTSSLNSYTSLVSIERENIKYSFLYVNNKTANLAFRNEDGSFVTLYDFYGNNVTIEDVRKLTVIYDDANGDVRYFIDGQIARYMKGNMRAFAEGIKVYDADFTLADGSKDSICFNPGNVSGVRVNGIVSTDTAEPIGIQTNENNNDIRLVSGLDTLYYGAVGYEARAYKADGTVYTDDAINRTSNTVYTEVIAGGERVPASKYGYDYFSTLVISGDFTNYKDSYILVKPYTRVGNSIYYGKEVRINILGNGSYEYVEIN